jgi:hypothetical protein
MTINVKTVSGVGYLLIDMLRFWHGTVDCASFGLLPEISLLVGLLAPFWLLAPWIYMQVVMVAEVEVVAMMPMAG